MSPVSGYGECGTEFTKGILHLGEENSRVFGLINNTTISNLFIFKQRKKVSILDLKPLLCNYKFTYKTH
jgi:hypothetical protein